MRRLPVFCQRLVAKTHFRPFETLYIFPRVLAKPTSVLLGHPVFCQFLLAKTHFRHFRETCILPACSSKSPFPSFLVPFISLECSGKNTLPSFTVSYYRQIIFTYVLISVQSNSFEKNHSFFFFSFLSV